MGEVYWHKKEVINTKKIKEKLAFWLNFVPKSWGFIYQSIFPVMLNISDMKYLIKTLSVISYFYICAKMIYF